MPKLTEAQSRVLNALQKLQRGNRAYTFADLARECQFRTQSTAHKHVQRLNELGVIARPRNNSSNSHLCQIRILVGTGHAKLSLSQALLRAGRAGCIRHESWPEGEYAPTDGTSWSFEHVTSLGWEIFTPCVRPPSVA